MKFKVQNTALRKILGAFRSAPVKAMQRDAEILPVNIRMKEICDRFAIRAIRETLCGNSQTATGQQRETLKGCLLKSIKWKVLMITSIGASVGVRIMSSLYVILFYIVVCNYLM
jgi:hypothetical protein